MNSRVSSIYQQKLASVSTSFSKAAGRAGQLGFSSALAEKTSELSGATSGQAAYAEAALTGEKVGLSSTASAAASGDSSLNSMLAALPTLAMSNAWSSSSGSQSSSMSQMMLPILLSLLTGSQDETALTNLSSIQESTQITGGKAAPDYSDLIDEAALKYNVPSSLIKGVIMTESSFRAEVTGPSGSQGLMQLMPATARSLGVTDSFDPAQNIEGGTKYLRQMLDTFGQDVRLALAAYNCGPNRLQNLGVTSSSNADEYSRLSSGVRNYVSTVLGHCSTYV